MHASKNSIVCTTIVFMNKKLHKLLPSDQLFLLLQYSKYS